MHITNLLLTSVLTNIGLAIYATNGSTSQIELHQSLPSHILAGAPKLDWSQAGHLRHFHNLASQIDGEWAHMGSQEPAQEFLDAYRYQLAAMAYAAGAAHYHHMDAMRSLFKDTIYRLIKKMLRREVWSYWYLTSQSGPSVDPDQKELRKPLADPVVKENIMYSGHLLLMTSLYAMLFDDDEFEKKDSLQFLWDPIFWGLGPETYSYNTTTLQDAIVKELERTGWMGVCCEPNNVFVVCNQFPFIAIRYNDVRKGTNNVKGVLENYVKAWDKIGMLSPGGLVVDTYMVRQGIAQPAATVDFSAWAGAFLNSWNPKLAQSYYANQTVGFLTLDPSTGEVKLQAPQIAQIIRELLVSKKADPNAPSTLEQAKNMANLTLPTGPQLLRPTFGYIAKWVSELGSPETMKGLLAHADKHMNPSWDKGGLYYPRNDLVADEKGEFTYVDPFTGNGAIGYARLNVKDGQRKMYEKPWTSAQLRKRPYVDNVTLADGVDFLRGSWIEDSKALVMTMRTWNGKKTTIHPVARDLPHGEYGLYIGESLHKSVSISSSKPAADLALEVGPDQVDVVLLQK